MILLYGTEDKNKLNKKFIETTYIEIIQQDQKMKTITDFNTLIPDGILFSIRQIDDMSLIKSDMLKKLIYNREIEVLKIGSKNFISRTSLIAYLEANTIPIQAN